MELKDYVQILIKRGWIIVLVAAVAAFSAIVFSQTQTPIYKSSVTLLVEFRPDWGPANTVKTLLRNYSLQIQRRANAQTVINRLQLDMSPETLLGKVTVDPDEANLTIQIDVKDNDPIIAQRIAQTLGEVFIEERTTANLELDKRDRVNVFLRDAALPGELFSPKWKINALAGGILGALLGGLVVLLLEWIESGTIRTPEDVERHVGVAVLGAIPVIPASEAALATESRPRLAFFARR
jgi:capsular polysaccharide biosynthesis protein